MAITRGKREEGKSCEGKKKTRWGGRGGAWRKKRIWEQSKQCNAMHASRQKEQEKQTNGGKEDLSKRKKRRGWDRVGLVGKRKRRKEKGGHTKGRMIVAYHAVSICQQDDDEW